MGMITPTIRRMMERIGMTDAALQDRGLHQLLAWMSPSFPVGAYTYSHGLEWAIEAGDVADAADLVRWLTGILRHGAGRSDAILLAHGLRAAGAGDETTLRELLDLALALQPSTERRLEATAQGDAFMAAICDAWQPQGDTPAHALFTQITSGPDPIPRGRWSYPLAVAVAAAAHALPDRAVVLAYLHAFAANIVSAGVRAIPLGQTDGQRVINSTGATISALADAALSAPLDEIGGCAFAADIASMNHETQYTRLFRS